MPEGRTVGAKPQRNAEPVPNPEVSALPARERKILAFERQWWTHAGAKEEAIRSEFALSAARYYQLLNAALDLPEALVFDPMLVKRLQRLRDARTQARSARTLGTQDSTMHHQ